MKTRKSIYQTLAKAGEPPAFPAPWTDLKCHKAFVHLPTDLTETLAQLIETYEESELLDCGICTIGETGEAIANPQLLANLQYVLAPTSAAQAPLVLAGLRSIAPDSWSVEAILSNELMAPLYSAAPDHIFVVFSAADLALFWSLGLPAIPFEGLANLAKDSLRTFCTKLRLQRTAIARGQLASTSSHQSTLFPILVNWSPTNLDLTDYADATAIAGHFKQLCQHLDLDLSRGGVWKPTECQIEAVKFRIKCGTWEDVRDALLGTLRRSSLSPFVGIDEKWATPWEEYLAALKNWEAASNSGDTSREMRTWKEVGRLQRMLLVAPLIELAAGSDPLSRNLSLVLAELSSTFHRQACLVNARISKATPDPKNKTAGQLPTADFHQLSALAGHISKLTEQVQLCQTRAVKKIKRLGGATT